MATYRLHRLSREAKRPLLDSVLDTATSRRQVPVEIVLEGESVRANRYNNQPTKVKRQRQAAPSNISNQRKRQQRATTSTTASNNQRRRRQQQRQREREPQRQATINKLKNNRNTHAHIKKQQNSNNSNHQKHQEQRTHIKSFPRTYHVLFFYEPKAPKQLLVGLTDATIDH